MFAKTPRMTAIRLINDARKNGFLDGLPPDEVPDEHMANCLAGFIEMMLLDFDYNRSINSNLAKVARGLAATVCYFEHRVEENLTHV